VFARLSNELEITLYWHSVQAQGKSWALNAGIHLAKGQYIFNIDSDVFLAENTIVNTVTYMEANPDIGAVTGFLVILPPEPDSGPFRSALTACEFLEYLTAFGVGRSYQSFFRAVYTLSGAYSVFRREAISSTFLYNKETVSEDTDLTFQLYERAPKYRVANLPDAKIYLEPIESLGALYSQRVRWQRGQLEVSARYKKLLKRPFWQLFGLAPTRALIIDHTLAFPRLVWLVFFPVLLLYGYSLSLLLTAYVIVYLFYLSVELAWFGAAYIFADQDIRSRVLANWFFIPLMPFYRIAVFFFRFSGFLHVITEPRTWRVADPVEQIRAGLKDIQLRLAAYRKTLQQNLPKQE
jgi:putative glycosyltransferase (exosortase G-associated)